MIAVDVHAHYVPPQLLDAVADGQVPGISVHDTDTGRGLQIGDNKPTRPLMPPLKDLDERTRWMDSEGISHQVLGTWADLFGYELDEKAAASWSRLIDDTLREAVGTNERFLTLSTPPLQHPTLAARLLEKAVEAGHAGALIGTEVGQRQLDDPYFDPVWSVASEMSLPVVIHPGYCEDYRLQGMGLINAVGRGNDTTIAVARILLGGVLERHPDLTFVVSHGGAAIPLLIGRLYRTHQLTEGTSDPRSGLERLYFDSVVHDPAALEHLCRVAAPGHVLLGSDYPFPIGDPHPRQIVETADLDQQTTEAILAGGTRLFGVSE